jgi:hypothetical protein
MSAAGGSRKALAPNARSATFATPHAMPTFAGTTKEWKSQEDDWEERRYKI